MDTKRLTKDIFNVKLKAKDFVKSSFDGNIDFCFTSKSDSTAFSRCFGVFCYNFLGMNADLEPKNMEIAKAICDDLASYKLFREVNCANILLDKHYMQLLAFSLSALSIVSPSTLNNLEVTKLIGSIDDLEKATNFAVRQPEVPQYGNINMAHGVLLVWLVETGRLADRAILDSWIQNHLLKMNDFGFWGRATKPTYIQFQNGYHQYEIFDYLLTDVPKEIRASKMVASMADAHGGFAPYPGGGGCYDYDAIHMLTRSTASNNNIYKPLLYEAAKYIITKQNSDGGFCDTHDVRPRSFNNLQKIMLHIFSEQPDMYSRLRHCITMLRPAHNRYNTHFTSYQREWSESNLWDTWFRLMALDRIKRVLTNENKSDSGYIDFPGIGFDHIAKK